MFKIKAQVDGKTVTVREAQKVFKYLMKHRKEYQTENDVRIAFDEYIRLIRGDKESA